MANLTRTQLEEVVPTWLPESAIVVTFDAPLAGGAATLRYDAAEDAEPGHHDPADQAKWEAYMLLIAITMWRHLLAQDVRRLLI